MPFEDKIPNGIADLPLPLLQEVIEHMGEGLLVTSHDNVEDPENRVVLMNDAYKSMYGSVADQLYIGMPVSGLVSLISQRSSKERTQALMEKTSRALRLGTPYVVEVPQQKRFFHCKGIRRESGGYIIVHSDVTILRSQNEQLKSASEAATEASKAKSSFLATMSHEIRTPMNGILGVAELLSDTMLSGEQSKYVDTIRSSAMALTDMISDILDFSKIEAGHLEIHPEPTDLHKLLRDTCEALQPLAMGKGLVMDLLISEEVPSHAMLDAPRVRQVVTNLLGNAIKFTHFGGIDLCVSGEDTLRIRVSDTGIGIPGDQIDHIFEPFEQVQSGRRRLFEGTGLGLAITQQLVQAMAGSVSLKSQLGYGTDVVVQMPLVRVHPADMLGGGDIDAADLTLKGRRILLVEDNLTNQFVVRKMLEKREAEVRVVSNGQEALDVYDPAHFDLVLMDISMPVLTGHDACRLIRKRQEELNWPHRPILALTGNAFESDRKEAFDSGMDGFLTKPIRLDDLLKTVATHLPVQ